jgi:NAD(P)-dependent dehydrogenase (short-subunit alcohol dehydrogenase family)
MRAQFMTARAAARPMIQRRSGVILAITATTARLTIPNIGGTGVTFDAIESLCRQWAAELGPHGVRVVWLRTTGIPEALHGERSPDYERGSGEMTRDELTAWMRARTMLDRLTSLDDVATWRLSDVGSRACHDRLRSEPQLWLHPRLERLLVTGAVRSTAAGIAFR